MNISVNFNENYLFKQVNGQLQMIKLDKKINPIDSILEFIVENYPVTNYSKVLEIAAGNGNFSDRLVKYGYNVTAMDPKINLKKDVNYNLCREYFHEYTDISSYDLGIAIHPCGIHKDIIKNFKINEKALFLMPCYNITCDDNELSSYNDNEDWLNYLQALNPKMKRKEFFKDVCFDLLLQSFSNAFYTK